MNLYQAILLAADHIERNPGEFNFNTCDLPDGPGCGTPGCALGWIGVFGGAKERGNGLYCGIALVAFTDYSGGFESIGTHNPLMKITQSEFYDRMDALVGSWKENAADCARALRLYANKYHAPKVPDWNAIASTPLPPDEQLQAAVRGEGDLFEAFKALTRAHTQRLMREMGK